MTIKQLTELRDFYKLESITQITHRYVILEGMRVVFPVFHLWMKAYLAPVSEGGKAVYGHGRRGTLSEFFLAQKPTPEC